jgi:DNA processing protein
MITTKALIWSIDESITGKQLVSAETQAPLFPDEKSAELAKRCDTHDIHGNDAADSSYHYKRSRLSSVPPVMYRKGDITLLDRPILSIVGPRMPSMFLQTVTQDLCSRLWSYQLVTMSGGAEWIDRLAHQYSLDHGVSTVVVLGGGFRRYQKRRERDFFQQIVDAGGLILSEWKLNQPPTHYTFPQRNRIIAGCADVVFVPGAAVGSGSLITVDFALQFGIPVVTVPGSLYEPTCAWTNTYLCEKKIAGVLNLDDVLTRYFSRKEAEHRSVPPMLSETERNVLQHIQKQPISVASLAGLVMYELPYLLEILMHLEMKQLIFAPEPWMYMRK